MTKLKFFIPSPSPSKKKKKEIDKGLPLFFSLQKLYWALKPHPPLREAREKPRTNQEMILYLTRAGPAPAGRSLRHRTAPQGCSRVSAAGRPSAAVRCRRDRPAPAPPPPPRFPPSPSVPTARAAPAALPAESGPGPAASAAPVPPQPAPCHFPTGHLNPAFLRAGVAPSLVLARPGFVKCSV